MYALCFFHVDLLKLKIFMMMLMKSDSFFLSSAEVHQYLHRVLMEVVHIFRRAFNILNASERESMK